MMIYNIYLYEGDIDGNLFDYFEIIEYEDNLKLYASVGEGDNDDKMVRQDGPYKKWQGRN